MTKRLRNGIVWAAAVLLVAATAAVSAQAQGQAPPQQPAPAVGTQITPYVVGRATPPETPGAPSMDLSLEAAIQLAMEHNLELQVARMNPQIQDYLLVGARAFYKPTLTGSNTYTGSSSVTTSVLDNVATNRVQHNQSFNGSVSQRAPWYGGNGSISFNNSRSRGVE